MELQVYDVVLEDRYPRGSATSWNARDLDASPLYCDDDFADRALLVPAPPTAGCIAFLFGRTEEGASVCVRLTGVCPCLFFCLDDGSSPSAVAALRRRLEHEVHETLEVTVEHFAHFYGFEPDANSPSGRARHAYAKVRFPSLASWREAVRLHKEDGTAQEWFVDPLTRFLVDARVRPGGWVRLADVQPCDLRVTTCDVEVTCASLAPVLGDDRPSAPYVVVYYDLETLGLDPHTSEIIQVSLVVVGKHGTAVDKHLVAVGTVAPIAGVVVHECSDEAALLRHTRALLVRHDPDFVVAYNGVNFDNAFLDVRARKCDVPEFWFLSRFACKPSRLRELALQSSGMGDNLLRYFEMPGRCTLDWFIKLKRDLTSEPSYKLDHFARTLCHDEKIPMDYRDIPKLQAGTPEDRARLGEYCVHDSYLLERLNQARTMLVEVLQFAYVFGVVPEWIYFRGQQVRFVAHLLAKARTSEAVPLLLQRPPEGWSGEGQTGFEGATVNEPKRGFYTHPVVVLDWKSLYPSIMMSHNLCHSTWVRDPERLPPEWRARLTSHPVAPGWTTHFVSPGAHKGILPRILEELLSERAKAKRDVKRQLAIGDARARELAKVYDGRQLALKVACNSVYGACGAVETGKYPCLAVSATTTYEGRQAMVVKKRILPERFPGIDVVYGDTDSVMVTFAGVTDVQECARLGATAAAFVTQHFVDVLGLPHMELEFEKAYLPYLLENKKRYLGLKYEPDAAGVMTCKGVDAKGIETERRDTLPFLKRVMRDVSHALLYDMDEHLALARFRDHMKCLIDDEVPFDEFVLRKNLSAKVAGKVDCIAHARVNALRASREPGSEEAVGNQVEYVIVNGHRKDKTTQLAEDPVFAREQGLKLNRLWYFEHAIEEPMRKLLGCLSDAHLPTLFQTVRTALDRERLGIKSLSSFRSAAGAAASTTKPWIPRPVASDGAKPKRVRTKRG